MSDVLAVLVRVTALLDELGIAYAVGGSLASSLHGEPRATHDIDILVALDEEGLDAFAARLGDGFYLPREAALEAVRSASSFNVLDLATGQKIDVFVSSREGLDGHQLETAEWAELPGTARPIRVTSAPAVVLRKLTWFRSGGGTSERQWRDVLSVLRVQGGAIDRRALLERAGDLGLVELLERAFAEADAG